MRVSATSSTASRNQESSLRGIKIPQLFSGGLVVNDGSDRHRDKQVCAILTMTVRPLPMSSPIGMELARVTKFQKSIQVLVTLQINVSAATTVAATGPASGNKFLPAKGYAAVPTVTTCNVNFGFVNEHLGFLEPACRRWTRYGANLASSNAFQDYPRNEESRARGR
jgi:hypothetical protein